MNAQDDSIVFEIEKPTKTSDGLSLSLLDLNVTIKNDGSSSFDFYKKKAKKPLFVNYKSWLPESAKRNFNKNERERIRHRCTSTSVATKRDLEFDELLKTNGYPTSFIERTKLDAARNHSEKRSTNDADRTNWS